MENDVVAGIETITLKDPYTRVKMTVPSRSRKCKHKQCFEASTFFSLNRTVPTWECPVCYKVIDPNDLIVDGYMDEIVQKTNGDVDSVTINTDGTWELPGVNITTIKSSEKKPSRNIVNIDDEIFAAGTPKMAGTPKFTKTPTKEIEIINISDSDDDVAESAHPVEKRRISRPISDDTDEMLLETNSNKQITVTLTPARPANPNINPTPSEDEYIDEDIPMKDLLGIRSASISPSENGTIPNQPSALVLPLNLDPLRNLSQESDHFARTRLPSVFTISKNTMSGTPVPTTSPNRLTTPLSTNPGIASAPSLSPTIGNSQPFTNTPISQPLTPVRTDNSTANITNFNPIFKLVQDKAAAVRQNESGTSQLSLGDVLDIPPPKETGLIPNVISSQIFVNAEPDIRNRNRITLPPIDAATDDATPILHAPLEANRLNASPRQPNPIQSRSNHDDLFGVVFSNTPWRRGGEPVNFPIPNQTSVSQVSQLCSGMFGAGQPQTRSIDELPVPSTAVENSRKRKRQTQIDQWFQRTSTGPLLSLPRESNPVLISNHSAQSSSLHQHTRNGREFDNTPSVTSNVSMSALHNPPPITNQTNYRIFNRGNNELFSDIYTKNLFTSKFSNTTISTFQKFIPNKFQPSIFYKEVKVISKHLLHNLGSIRFQLSRADSDVLELVDVHSGLKLYKLYLLTGYLTENIGTAVKLEYPEIITFKVNGKSIELQSEYPTPLDLTQLIDYGGNNNVDIEFFNSKKNVVFFLVIVKLIPDLDLAYNLLSSSYLHKDAILNEMKNSKKDHEIETVNEIISIKDPFTRMKLKVPVRSHKCKHTQCFDASSYFAINRTTPKWECPICYINVQHYDLFVDGYMYEVLQKTDEECEGITIAPDATWKEKKPVDIKKQKQIEVICID
ncbi:SUMO ligase siz1 [Terramyces sp. JEL0728]|nr:SUMO ligase siz1 [Terramyces sp. JEL0728]